MTKVAGKGALRKESLREALAGSTKARTLQNNLRTEIVVAKEVQRISAEWVGKTTPMLEAELDKHRTLRGKAYLSGNNHMARIEAKVITALEKILNQKKRS